MTHVPTGYCDSKLMNAVMASELSKSGSVCAVSTSPGFCYTELFRNSSMSVPKLLLFLPFVLMFMRSAARGAMNVTYCLLADGLTPGAFYRDCQLGEKENAKVREQGAKGVELMRLSEELVKDFL